MALRALFYGAWTPAGVALCPLSPATCLWGELMASSIPACMGFPSALVPVGGGGMWGLCVSWWLKISVWKPMLQRFPLRPVTHTAVPGGSAHRASPRPE